MAKLILAGVLIALTATMVAAQTYGVDGTVYLSFSPTERVRSLDVLPDQPFSLYLMVDVPEGGIRGIEGSLQLDADLTLLEVIWPDTALDLGYDFPLPDGRNFIIGNHYADLLNRRYMMLSLSSDGMVFEKMCVLLDEPTHRRIDGLRKEEGYHYPHSLVDGDRLLVVYSVSKEDIECAVVDTTQL